MIKVSDKRDRLHISVQSHHTNIHLDIVCKIADFASGRINVHCVAWEMTNSRSQPWTPNSLEADTLDWRRTFEQ